MIKSGVVCIYKEAGWTSFDVVKKLRGILNTKKIGHTGTLDPDATGVLPICFGKATGLCEVLSHSDKVYEATLLLGIKTDTQDISGNIIDSSIIVPSEADIREVISGFIGKQFQTPPMYSAKKVNGKKLYEYARKGQEIERKPSEIEIYDIVIKNVYDKKVDMTVFCSSGTYIRTLCNDIGQRLGCFGCMEALERTKVNCFDLKNSITIDKVKQKVDVCDYSFILPIDYFYENYDKAFVDISLEKLVKNGAPIPIDKTIINNGLEKKYVRLYMNDVFVGIYEVKDKVLKVKKMYLE